MARKRGVKNYSRLDNSLANQINDINIKISTLKNNMKIAEKRQDRLLSNLEKYKKLYKNEALTYAEYEFIVNYYLAGKSAPERVFEYVDYKVNAKQIIRDLERELQRLRTTPKTIETKVVQPLKTKRKKPLDLRILPAIIIALSFLFIGLLITEPRLTGFSVYEANFKINETWNLSNGFVRVSMDDYVEDQPLLGFVSDGMLIINLNEFNLTKSGKTYVDIIINGTLVDSQSIDFVFEEIIEENCTAIPNCVNITSFVCENITSELCDSSCEEVCHEDCTYEPIIECRNETQETCNESCEEFCIEELTCEQVNCTFVGNETVNETICEELCYNVTNCNSTNCTSTCEEFEIEVCNEVTGMNCSESCEENCIDELICEQFNCTMIGNETVCEESCYNVTNCTQVNCTETCEEITVIESDCNKTCATECTQVNCTETIEEQCYETIEQNCTFGIFCDYINYTWQENITEVNVTEPTDDFNLSKLFGNNKDKVKDFKINNRWFKDNFTFSDIEFMLIGEKGPMLIQISGLRNDSTITNLAINKKDKVKVIKDKKWLKKMKKLFGEVFTQEEEPESTLQTDVFAMEDSTFDNVTITMPTKGKVNFIVKCGQWDFVEGLCNGQWEVTEIPFTQSNNSITFTVSNFSGYAGASINILNIVTYLRNNENWTVLFETEGIANLTISGVNNTNWTEFLKDNELTDNDEMRFIDLECNNISLKDSLYLVKEDETLVSYNSLSQDDSMIISALLIPDYNCSSTGSITNNMLIAGYATLKFEFGNDTAYAYDPSITSVVLNSTYGQNSSGENLTAYLSGEDDTNFAIYDWRKNNISDAVLNMPFNVNGSNKNTTNVRDYTTYGNNGSVVNDSITVWPRWNQSCGAFTGSAGCYEFDGIDDCINVADDTSLRINGSITIAGWIYIRQDKNQDLITQAFQSYRTYFSASGNAISLRIDSNNMILSSSSMNLDEWIFYAATYDLVQTEANIYINGLLDVSNLTTSNEFNPSSLGWGIGCNQAGSANNNNFNGSIDHAMIWNRSLSANEVAMLYNAGAGRYNRTHADATSVGDIWQAVVTPNNGTTDGNQVYSNNVTILSTDCDYFLSECKGTGWVANSKYCLIQDLTGYAAGKTGCMFMDTNDITLDCQNHTMSYNGSGDGIEIATSGITIENCVINQYETGIGSGNKAGNTTIKYCNVTNVTVNGIRTEGGNATIVHNIVYSLAIPGEGKAMSAEDNGNNVSYNNITFWGDSLTGLDLSPSQNSTAYKNNIEICGASGSTAISIHTLMKGTINSNTISTNGSGCTLVLGISSTGTVNDSVIKNNEIRMNASSSSMVAGILLGNISDSTVIKDNTLTTGNTGTQTQGGLHIADLPAFNIAVISLTNITITNNTVTTNTGGPGILLSKFNNSQIGYNTINVSGDNYGIAFMYNSSWSNNLTTNNISSSYGCILFDAGAKPLRFNNVTRNVCTYGEINLSSLNPESVYDNNFWLNHLQGTTGFIGNLTDNAFCVGETQHTGINEEHGNFYNENIGPTEIGDDDCGQTEILDIIKDQQLTQENVTLNWSAQSGYLPINYIIEYSGDSGSTWTREQSAQGRDNEFSDGTTSKTINIGDDSTEYFSLTIPKIANVSRLSFDFTIVDGLSSSLTVDIVNDTTNIEYFGTVTLNMLGTVSNTSGVNSWLRNTCTAAINENCTLQVRMNVTNEIEIKINNIDLRYSNYFWDTSSLEKGSYRVRVIPNDYYVNGTVNTTGDFYIGDTSPSVDLLDPEDTWYVNSSAVFECRGITIANMQNISLYHNNTGTWHMNWTNTATGSWNETIFNITGLDVNSFVWGCYACSDQSTCNFSSVNRTVTVENTNPLIEYKDMTPENETKVASFNNNIYINVSTSDASNNLSAFIDWNNSLKGWWRLEQGNGSHFVDESSYGNNGTCRYSTGTCPSLTTGMRGEAYKFNGLNNYRIDIDDDVSLQAKYTLTLSAWVKGTDEQDVSENTYPVGKGTAYGLRVASLGSPSLAFILRNSTNDGWHSLSSGFDMLDDRWHHIVGTYDGSYMKLYMDGQLKASSAQFDDTIYTSSGTDLMIGTYSNSYGNFNGSIDEVMLFDRALSDEEINASYSTGIWRLENNFTSLDPGRYPYRAYVVDQAGNLNKTLQRYITINSEPLISSVVLNSTTGSNFSSENLTAYTTYNDNDSDTIYFAYDFRKSSISDAVLNMPFNVNGSNGNWTNVKDYTIWSYNGSLSNGSVDTEPRWNETCGAFTDSGGCYIFDGNDDVIFLPSAILNNTFDFTVEFWANVGGSGEAILSGAKSAGANNELLIFNQANLNTYMHGVPDATGISIGDSSWHHIAITREGAIVKTYKDGVLVHTNNSRSTAAITIADNGLVIGQEQDNIGGGFSPTQAFSGRLDNFKIFNRSLSADDVAMIYNSGNGMYNTTHSDSTSKTDIWSVAVSPFDDYEEGDTITSNSVHIITSNATVNLTSPEDEWYANHTAFFECKGTSDIPLTSVTLYHNYTGTWAANQTISNLRSKYVEMNFTLPNLYTEKGFVWNCRFCDAEDCYFDIANHTLHVDLTRPAIAYVLNTPANNTKVTSFDNFAVVNVSTSDASNNYSAFIDWNRSLVGWYRLEGYNGTHFVDSSTWGNNGTCALASNDCPNLTTGMRGKAYKFDGIDDYVEIPHDNSLDITSGVTIEAWIKFKGGTSYSKWIAGKISAYSMFISDNVDKLYVNINGTQTAGNAVITENTWTHVAFTHNSSNYVDMYINGQLDKSYASTAIDTNTNVFRIGWYSTAPNHNFNGSIDEVKVWNRALSPEEINASYNANIYNLYHNFTSLVPGNYSYKAYVVDMAGNLNMTLQRRFVVNAPPVISNVELNTSTGANLTSENLTAYTTYNDNDSDTLTFAYDWRKESISEAVLNMPFDVNGSNKNKTNVKDYTIWSNNGSLYGPIWNASCGAFSGSGGCYEFDGDDDDIEIADDDSLDFGTGEFAISFWVYSNGYYNQGSAWNSVLHKNGVSTGANNDYGFALLSNEKINFLIDNASAASYASSNSAINGAWHHIVGVRRENSSYLYVDGIEQSDVGNVIDSNTTNTAPLRFGSDGSASRFFNGSIDQVTIWNRTLSADEIAALYNAGNGLYNTTISNITRKGDTWSVAVTAFDPYEEGTTLLSNSLIIISSNVTVNLTSPETEWYTNHTAILECKGVSSIPLTSVTLFHNYTGTWAANQTESFPENGKTINFTLPNLYTEKGFVWNCRFCDAEDCYFDIANHTLHVDLTRPAIAYVLNTPANNTKVTSFDNFAVVNVSTSDASNNYSAFIDWNRSLRAWWRFEGYNGTHFVDSSTWGNNGTCALASNDCPNLTTGMRGKAYKFDGKDDYIDAGSESSLDIVTNITISFWAKPAGGISAYSAFLGRGLDSSWGFYGDTGIAPDNIYLRVITGSGTVTATTSDIFEVGKWTHIVGRYDGANIDIFGDGTEITSSAYAQTGSMDNSGTTLQIGKISDRSGYFFNGTIDEVMVWDRALSNEEINATYNAGIWKLYRNFTSLESGNYSYQAYVVDMAGNLNMTLQRRFVVNAPPVISSVVLNSTTSANLTSENLTAYTTYNDNDSDNVVFAYDWREGGVSEAILNLPFNVNGSNEDWTNVKDYTTYSNNGTLGNGSINTRPRWNASCNAFTGSGGCYEFDGYYDYIQIPHSEDLSVKVDLTVMFWVNPAGAYTNTSSNIIAKGYGGTNDRNYHCYLVASNHKITCVFGNGTANQALAANSAMDINTWSHYAITTNSSSLNSYINGAFDKTAPRTIANFTNNTLAMRMGILNGPVWHLSFNGSLDQIMVWNRSLSSNEISMIYNNGVGLYNTTHSDATEKGDIWTVAVTPFDLYEEGTTVTSNSVYISSTNVTVNLTSPESEWYTNHTAILECKGISSIPLTSVTLYHNYTGTWAANQTESSPISGKTINFTLPNLYTEKGFVWNCRFCDAEDCYFADANRTLHVDLTRPAIEYTDPTPTNNTKVTSFDNNAYINISTSDASNNYSAFIDWNRSLRGWWRLEGYNGTHFVDSSTWSNNATCDLASNDCPNLTTGMRGKAYRFDGIDDYITLGTTLSDTYGDGVTVALWVKFDFINNSFWCMFGGSSNLYFDISSQKIRAYTGELVDTAISGSTTLETGKYYLAAFTYNGTTKRLYLNGNLENEETTSGDISLSTVDIGRSTSSARRYTNGTIDEVMFFDRALSPEEINASYNANIYNLYRNFTSLEPGNYSYIAYVVDMAGNLNMTLQRRFDVNAPPVISNVELNTSTGANLTSENLTAYTTYNDNDSDNVYLTYDWRKESISDATLNMPFNVNGSNKYTTNIKDYTTFSNNGSLGDQGNITTFPIWNDSCGAFSGSGGCYEFSGYADCIEIPSDNSLNSNYPTISLWILAKDASATSYLLTREDAGGSDDRGYYLYFNSNNLRFRITDDVDSDIALISFSSYINQWAHVVATANETDLNIFINGEFKVNASRENVPTIDFDAEDAKIGCYHGINYPLNVINGSIDQVQIWNRSLAADEIAMLYNNGNPMYNTTHSDATTKGDIWSVAVTPFDIYEEGPTVTSNSLTIISSNISVNLTSPETEWYTNHTAILECKGISSIPLTSVTLFHNYTGTWAANQTESSPESGKTINFTLPNLYTEKGFVWNCRFCDAEDCYFDIANRTLHVDLTRPAVEYTNSTPTNNTKVTSFDNWAYVNVSTSDASNNYSAFIDWNRSLIGWWRLEGYNGTHLVDSSTWGNNGTCALASNDCPNLTTGARGKAYRFDGIDDYIEIPHDDTLNITNGVTVEAWIKFKGGTSYSKWIAGKISAYSMFIGDNVDKLYVNINGTQTAGNAVITENTWTHVAFTHNSSNYVDMYINGQLDKSYASTAIDANTNVFRIGWYSTAPNHNFNGSIDEVMIWNRALSPEEINATYNAGIWKLYRNFTSLDSGEYTYKAYVVDMAGNLNMTLQRRFDVNAPPVISNVELNTSTGANLTSENLTAYITYNDNDSDTVYLAYDWREGGVSDATLNMPFNVNGSNENYTNVKDYTTYSNNGTLADWNLTNSDGNTPAIWNASCDAFTGSGGCYEFDGTDDYIDIPHTALNSTINSTTEFWIKSTGANDGIISGARASQTNEYLVYNQANIMVYITSIGWASGAVVNDGNWHYVVVTRSNTTIKVYKDGALQATNNTMSPGPLGLEKGGLIIGQDQDSLGGGFSSTQSLAGSLDQLKFYNRTLSAEEIAMHYYSASGFYNRTHSDATEKGDVWTVAVTPFDDYEEGKTVTSNSLTIEDTNITVTLIDPQDDWYVNNTVKFECEVSSSIPLTSISLWHNNTGTWAANATTSLSATSAIVHFTVTEMDTNSFVWNCRACDAEDCYLATANRTLHVDITNPLIDYENPTPANNTLVASFEDNVYINVSTSDAANNYSAFIDWNRSLVGYWRLENTNGTWFEDSSTWGNNGTCSGTECPNLTTGMRGKAYKFDGIDDAVTIPDSSSLNFANNFSISAWIKTNTTSTQGIFGEGYSTNILGLNAGRIILYVNTNDCYKFSTITLTDNQWYHVVGTYDTTNNVTVYIDGLFAQGSNKHINCTNSHFSSNPSYIGLLTSNYFNGSIDEVMVWDRALSREEVNASYNAGIWKLYRNFTSLEPGEYSYKAYVVDMAGNMNETLQRRFDINAPPVISNIELNTSTGANLTSENLTAYPTYNDNDSDTVYLAYDWREGGVSDAVLNMPFNVNGSNGNTSNAKDYTTWSNNGSIAWNTSTSDFGPIWNSSCTAFNNSGGCYEFDGDNDYIEIKDDETLEVGTGDYSISVWFKRNPSDVSNERLLYKGGLSISDEGYSIWMSDTSLSIRLSNGSQDITLGGAHSGVNNWSYLVFVINRSENMDYYMNGAFISGKNISNFTGQDISNSINLRIGSANNRIYFNGSIDQVNIWNRSLTANEIAMLYNGGAGMYNRTHSDATTKSDTWTVAVTPFDDYEEGETVTSNSLTIISSNVTVNLTSPDTEWYTNHTALLECKASSATPLTSVTLYHNYTGTWAANQTESSPESGKTINFTLPNLYTEKGFVWNCRFCDAEDCYFDITNRTLHVDLTRPAIEYTDPTPVNNTKVTSFDNWAYVNVSSSDASNNYSAFIDWNRSLRAWWRLEGYNGTHFVDRSTWGNNGTCDLASNECPNLTTGMRGKAYRFDGVDDTLETSSAPSLNITGTLEAWIKVDGWGSNYDSIIFKGPGTSWANIDYGMFRSVATSQFLGTINDGTNNMAGSGPKSSNLELNTWYHLTFTWNGSVSKFYTNGLETGTDDWNTSAGERSGNLNIGARVGGGGYFLNGSIDEVKIWDRALSPEEINASYNANIWKLYRNFTSLDSGEYTYKAYVVDMAGNMNETLQRRFDVNAPPVISNVELNTSTGANLTTENLTAYVTYNDNDSDTISLVYDWRESSVSDALLNMPFNINGSTESTTNVKDYTTWSNNGTAGDSNLTSDDGNTPPIWNSSCGAFTSSGGCYEFDGFDDYILTSDQDMLINISSKTVAFWFNTKGYSGSGIGNNVLIGGARVGAAADRQGYSVYLSSASDLKLAIANDSEEYFYVTYSGISQNQWYFVTFTHDYDNGKMYLYVNGTQVGYNNLTGYTPNPAGGSWKFIIGRYSGYSQPTSSRLSFNGSIDQVQVWNRTMTADEIAMLYNAGNPMYNTTHSDATTKGDIWSVAVSPFDIYEEGPTVTSNDLTIATGGVNVSLDSPVNGWIANSTVKFECTGTSDIALINISLYHNNTGTWHNNKSNTVSGTSNATYFILNTLDVNSFVWNCLACDNEHSCAFSAANYTLTIDNTNPDISFSAPTVANNTEVISMYNNAYVNVSINDTYNNYSSFIDWNRSLVGWWRLERDNGTFFVDSSTWGNNGTCDMASDNCPNWTMGARGKAYKFDGIDDTIDLGDMSEVEGITALTVSAWVSPNQPDLDSAATIIEKQGIFKLWVDQNEDVLFTVYNSGGSGINSQEADAFSATDYNKWYHIVGEYNGVNITVYVDGLMGETVGSLTTATRDISNSIEISSTWNGTIDDVQIYNRILSREEINATYNAGIYKLYHNFTDLDPGTYTYKAYVVDMAGNYNETLERKFTVNTPPTVGQAELNSTLGTNLTWENLTIHALDINDNDSDTVILAYDFRRFGISEAVVNMPFNVNGSNENNSNVKDYSTYGNNGTLYNAIWNASCGAFAGSGGCYDFDGSGDYIDMGNVFTENQTGLTIEAWVFIREFNNASSANERTPIVSGWFTWAVGAQRGYLLSATHVQSSNVMAWQLHIANGTDYIGVSTAAETPDDFGNVFANRWYHVVGTFKGDEYMRIYINGELNSSKTGGLIPYMAPEFSSNDFIGRTQINTNYTNGQIDNVRIYNRTLSAEEIAMLYHGGAGFYNRTHANATDYGEVWKAVIIPFDSKEEGQTVESNTVTINSPPSKVILDKPVHGNRTITNRSVSFTWLPATDADSDTITYNLSIRCYAVAGGGCSPTDDRDYGGISATSYNLTEDTSLRYLRDDTYYYNWTVTAYDGYYYSTESNQSNFSMISEVIIAMINDSVEFGNLVINDIANTSDRSPKPLLIENKGNVLTDINLSSATRLFQTGPFPGSNFQYRVNETSGYENAFNSASSQTTWTNIPEVNESIIVDLNYSSTIDRADIHIHVEVPGAEPSGDKSSTLTFIGWYA